MEAVEGQPYPLRPVPPRDPAHEAKTTVMRRINRVKLDLFRIINLFELKRLKLPDILQRYNENPFCFYRGQCNAPISHRIKEKRIPGYRK